MLKRCVWRVRALEGGTLTDYGLILALITVVCAAILTLFGERIDASIATFTSGF